MKYNKNILLLFAFWSNKVENRELVVVVLTVKNAMRDYNDR
jgi:hypothetical protein